MTSAEFLAWEGRQDLRYEFDGTDAVAMTGSSAAHNRIVYNLRTCIERRLSEPCQAFSTDLKVLVNGRARYPDVLITCRPPKPADLAAEHPLIVFEVVSPRYSHADRIEKVIDYQAAPSIQRYIILEQAAIGATVFARQADFWHATTRRSGDIVALPEVEIAFPLHDYYARLDIAASHAGRVTWPAGLRPPAPGSPGGSGSAPCRGRF